MTFDFGAVTNPGSGAARITIDYNVRLRDVAGDPAGTLLTNTASLNYDGISLPPPKDSQTSTVLEPNLEITKTIEAGAPKADAGDTLSFKVLVQNATSRAPPTGSISAMCCRPNSWAEVAEVVPSSSISPSTIREGPPC